MKIGNPATRAKPVLGPELASLETLHAPSSPQAIGSIGPHGLPDHDLVRSNAPEGQGVSALLGGARLLEQQIEAGTRQDDTLRLARRDGDALSRRLTRSSIIAFLVYVIGAGLTYVTQLVIARLVGADSYGVYSYVLVWVTLLAYGSTLGFNVSLMRFVPAYQASRDWALARGVIQYACQRVLAVSLIALVAGMAIVLAWSGQMQPELTNTFLVGLAMAPLIALYLIGMSVLRTFGGVVTALAPERVVRDGLVLVFIGLVIWGGLRPRNATLVMEAMLISSAMTLGLVIVSAYRLTPPSIRTAKPAYAVKDWLPSILPLMIMAGAEILMSRAGVIMLGLDGDAKSAGVFSLAFNMAALVALPQVAVNTMFAPTVSDLYARGDRAGLQSLFTRSAVLTLLGSAGLGLPLLLLAGPLLHWFGKDFASGAPLICILVIGRLFAAANGPQQTLMTMVGHERTGAMLLAAGAVVNVGGCAVAVEFSGAIGAAVVTTATLIAWNVGMAIFIYRRLQILPGLVAPFLFRRARQSKEPARAA